MATVEFHRAAAEAARAEQDKATDDTARAAYGRAWDAHVTAACHLSMLPHYERQAAGARRQRQASPPRRGRGQQALLDAALVENLLVIEGMPARHRAEAERWAAEAEKHAAAARERDGAITSVAQAGEMEAEAPAEDEAEHVEQLAQ